MRLLDRRLEAGLIAFWALLAGLSLAHNLALLDGQQRQVAMARARMVYSVVETTRMWNAGHGGVYAPVTPVNPPNPFLTDPQRDVTINGQPFTKINPAYMTRQISEMVQSKEGLSFHITSRKPIRPDNAPDPWEDTALARFERGQSEVLDHTDYHGVPSFRYMAVLKVTEDCVGCHAGQGFAVGDVRGGLSVTIPASQVTDEFKVQRRQAVVLHLAGFLLLSAASMVLLGRLRKSWQELEKSNARQERMVEARTSELRAANVDLARSNAELESFAYIASHDLQEPLRMMGSYARLIDRRYARALDEDGKAFLGFMVDGADRMKAMIDALLAYSRVGRVELDVRPLALDLVVDSALANLSAALSESGAVVHRPHPLPMVMGEMAQMVSLMQNLIGNAVKYRHPQHAPRLTITAEAGPQGWEVTVADNGIGIPPADRERIFQIFQRLHTRQDYPGTGIGLALCRRIVERHGGRIWVAESQRGAALRFTLPAVAGQDVAAAEQHA